MVSSSIEKGRPKIRRSGWEGQCGVSVDNFDEDEEALMEEMEEESENLI